MVRCSLLFFAATCLSSACVPAPADPVDQAAARSELADAMAAYGRAATSGDVDSILAWWTESPVLTEPGIHLDGRDALRGFLTGVLDSLEITAFTASTEEVEAGHDAAWERGRYGESFRHKVTGASVSITGRYLIRWRREPAGWRLHRVFAIPDLPPPDPATTP